MWGVEWRLLCRDYSDKEAGRNPQEKAESPGLCREKTTVSQGMEEENWIGKETPQEAGVSQGHSAELSWN